MREVPLLVKEMNPSVEAARACRATMDELMHGIGGEMETFKKDAKHWLEEIRSTRMATVAECSQMTKSLRDVRQFFLGSDHKEEITRLREFVDLCERLVALKESGTLDAITDTMLRLAV
jgi:hypothetical protein